MLCQFAMKKPGGVRRVVELLLLMWGIVSRVIQSPLILWRLMKRAIVIIAVVIAGVFALFSLEDNLVVWTNASRYNIPRNMEWSPEVEKQIADRQSREATASTQPTTATAAQVGTSHQD
jgi:hypothetical protein